MTTYTPKQLLEWAEKIAGWDWSAEVQREQLRAHADALDRLARIDIANGEVYAGLSRDPDTGDWYHLVLLPATTDKGLKWHGSPSGSVSG